MEAEGASTLRGWVRRRSSAASWSCSQPAKGTRGEDEKAYSRRVHGPAHLKAAEVPIAHAAGEAMHRMRCPGDPGLTLPQAPGQSQGTPKEEAGAETAVFQYPELPAGAGRRFATGLSWTSRKLTQPSFKKLCPRGYRRFLSGGLLTLKRTIG